MVSVICGSYLNHQRRLERRKDSRSGPHPAPPQVSCANIEQHVTKPIDTHTAVGVELSG